MHIVGTFMGLHAVPRGMNADEYTDECIRESLPAAAGTGVCEFADAFVERGAFSAEQAKRYFLKAKQLGFSLKVHADEMTPSGGTRLGVELGAKSADHLLKILDEDIALLAKSQTVATVLPLTAFCLGEEYAPARRLIDGGAIVAAACAGIVCGKAEKQLEVISQVSEEQTQQLKQYLAQTPVSVRLADTPYIFDIDVRLEGQGRIPRACASWSTTRTSFWKRKTAKSFWKKRSRASSATICIAAAISFTAGTGSSKKAWKTPSAAWAGWRTTEWRKRTKRSSTSCSTAEWIQGRTDTFLPFFCKNTSFPLYNVPERATIL